MTREQILAVAKPILFNTEMVQALLDDRKHVTRRVVKLDFKKIYGCACAAGKWNESYGSTLADIPSQLVDWYVTEKAKPPYQPGDLLYVRETFYKWRLPGDKDGLAHYSYRATDPNANKFPTGPDYDDEWKVYPWRPSIHMPKEAARIFLRVTDVRAERLRDITERQAEIEGVPEMTTPNIPGKGRTFAQGLGELWNSTIPKKDLARYGWKANPWVWVIEFERVVAE